MRVTTLVKQIIHEVKPRLRLGLGPMEKSWDSQYLTGRWDYLRQIDELGHYSIIAGYCKYLKPGGSILDAGCGEGILQGLLDPTSYSKYVGIDLSSAAIQRVISKQDEKTSFTVANIKNYTPTCLFDVIIFNESLYYLTDPVKTLKHYETFLKTQGIFIISMYLHEKCSLWKKLKEHYRILDKTTITNKGGASWVCKILQPLPS